ncbi:uncharacterized protein LOC144091539 isoform X2 [Stigmatopora argus]
MCLSCLLNFVMFNMMMDGLLTSHSISSHLIPVVPIRRRLSRSQRLVSDPSSPCGHPIPTTDELKQVLDAEAPGGRSPVSSGDGRSPLTAASGTSAVTDEMRNRRRRRACGDGYSALKIKSVEPVCKNM